MSQSATAGSGPPGRAAQRNAERILAVVAAVSRFAGLALPVSGVITGGGGFRSTVPLLLVALVGVESLALAVHCLRAGAVPTRWLAADAVLLAVVMWLGEQPSLTDTGANPWRGLYGFATAAIVAYALPDWPLGAAMGTAALPGLANVAAAFIDPVGYPLWNAVLDSLALVGSTAAVWVIAWLLRGSARALDGYQLAAVRRAQTLAVERERIRQAQAIRAGLLSTLEDVAAVDLDPVIAEQVRREVRWLRDVVETGLPEHEDDLPAGLRALVAEKVAGGLRIELQLPGGVPALAARRVGVLLGAVREALTNVAKHARTAQATVRVGASEGGVEVIVEDTGRGYHPGRVPAGTGQRGSIIDRVAEAGGIATIESAPGRGTRVRLWVPGGDQ